MLPWLAALAEARAPVVAVGEEDVADPHRWLERRDDADVRAWVAERDAEARGWAADGGTLEAIAAWRARHLDDRRAVTTLADHRAGTALWSVHDPVVREGAAPDARDRGRSWRTRVHVQAPGEAFPGVLVAEFGPEAPSCAAQLSPDGATVLWGRLDPADLDAEEPPSEPRACHLHLQAPGAEPEALLDAVGPHVAWSGEHLLVAHRDGRRGVVTEVVGEDPIERLRRRKPLSVWLPPDGRALVWTQGRRGGRIDGNLRLGVGPIDDLDWLGTGVAHPWLGYPSSPVGVRGDELVVLADTEAREVVRIDPERPGAWRTLVAERPGMNLVSARMHGDDLLVVWSRDGLRHLEVQPWDGTPPTRVDLGGPWTWVTTTRTHDDRAVIDAGSPTARRSWLRDADGALTPLDGAWEDEALVFEHHLVAAADGARIPVSLVRRRDLAPTADTPIWLTAYGGFDLPIALHLDAGDRLFLEAGGVVVTVHARGGSENGELWHEAALLDTHAVTFDDVLSAAEWFVDQGWTRPGRLVLSGSSHGGLTTAATVARRPELFGAAISHAGVLDLLRGPRFGSWWDREYGTLHDPEERAFLRAESPVHREPAGPLPPMLVITGARDPVVDPSHSYKLAAAWSALPGGPVLLRVDAYGSHGARARHGEEFGPRDYDAAGDATLAFVFRALALAVPEPPAGDDG